MTEGEWYRMNCCTHAHCPEGCAKPQPVLLEDGRMVCGRCAALEGVLVEVLPCRPGVCDD